MKIFKISDNLVFVPASIIRYMPEDLQVQGHDSILDYPMEVHEWKDGQERPTVTLTYCRELDKYKVFRYEREVHGKYEPALANWFVVGNPDTLYEFLIPDYCKEK